MYSLPQLPFPYNALEPHIDARTMEIHYTKHHQAYLDKLNTALDNLPELQNLTIEELLQNLDKVPSEKKPMVKNNGGGHANHALFWHILTPGGNQTPTGELKEAIDRQFDNLDNCKKAISDAAITQFGSGWGWLVVNQSGELEAISTANQDSPLLLGLTPILGIDVWEHAYYLNYQNRRPEYVTAFWNVVNWDKVEENYLKYKK